MVLGTTVTAPKGRVVHRSKKVWLRESISHRCDASRVSFTEQERIVIRSRRLFGVDGSMLVLAMLAEKDEKDSRRSSSLVGSANGTLYNAPVNTSLAGFSILASILPDCIQVRMVQRR